MAEKCWPMRNYEVRFPTLEAARPGTAVYRIRRLPDLKVVLGLELSVPEKMSCEALQGSEMALAVVRMELRTAAGRVLARQEATLRDWTWHLAPTSSPLPAKECSLDADSLFFEPAKTRGPLLLEVAVTRPAERPLRIQPSLASFAVYMP